MLVFTRRQRQRIIITHPDGTQIVIDQLEIRGDKTRIGITAPPEVRVDREEVHLARKGSADGDAKLAG